MLKSALVSSNLASAAWENETLHVEFKKGNGGRYLNTPCHIYEGLIQAESPGKYLHANVIGKYEYKADEVVGEATPTT